MNSKVAGSLFALLALTVLLIYGVKVIGGKSTRIIELKAEILQKEMDLKTLGVERDKLRSDYNLLLSKIAEAANKKAGVKPPKTNAELKERFSKAGYPSK